MNDSETLKQNASKTKIYLTRLLSAVEENEAVLGGGISRSITAETIRALKETQISFGNPRHMLSKLRLEDFKRLNVPEHHPLFRQAQESHDFYFISLNASFSALREVRFSRVLCRLQFDQADVSPIVQTLAPTQQWQDIAAWGGEGHVGIGADLSMQFTLPDDMLSSMGVPVAVKKIAAEAKGSAFLTLLPFRFSIGKVRIAATGIGNSFAQWDIANPEIRTQNGVTFALVFKVQQGTKRIKLNGDIYVTIHKAALITALQTIWEALSSDLRAPLEYDENLMLGVSEVWGLDLPQ